MAQVFEPGAGGALVSPAALAAELRSRGQTIERLTVEAEAAGARAAQTEQRCLELLEESHDKRVRVVLHAHVDGRTIDDIRRAQRGRAHVLPLRTRERSEDLAKPPQQRRQHTPQQGWCA